MCWGIVLCAGAVAAIPQTGAGAIWFIAQMAAAQILIAGVITLRAAIWKSNYPHLERGRITARLQAVREVVMVASSMAAAALCDMDSSAYAYVYPAAALLGILGIFALSGIHIRGEHNELKRLSRMASDISSTTTTDRTVNLATRHVFSNSWRILKTDLRFTRYIIAQLLVGISNQLTLAVVAMLVTQEIDMAVGAGFWIKHHATGRVAEAAAPGNTQAVGTAVRSHRL